MSSPSSPMPEQTVTSQQPALSEPQRLTDTFVAPSKTFTDLRRKTSWWVPFVLLSVFAMSFFVMIDKKVGFEQVARNMLANNHQVQQLPQDQQEKAIARTAGGLKYGGYAAPIFVLIYGVIIAAVLMATFNFGMDAQVPFNRALAIVMYGWLPSLIGTILAMISLNFGDPEGFHMENPVGTNPAYFLGFGTTSKFVYVMLSSIDVITLWCVVLIGIGFALNAKKRISTGAAIGTVAAWFFLYKLVSAGFAALRG